MTGASIARAKCRARWPFALAWAAAMSALLLLAGCAAPAAQPQTLAGSATALRLDAVATLAVGACDAHTAADYTGVIVARRAAAARLRSGQMSLAAAVQLQSLADDARAALDAACRGGRLDASALAAARNARQRMATLLQESDSAH